ncbi:tetratricopeptide repeat protein [Mucilaginibacter sp. dw_454]|uniref:tetratricopeptide repeat protein n=1 Tax=Mucilaginibacter sp. dw_454 TaxID=2720079 RepID=UPI001BD25C5A|nr:tetratricopeptide repeat protein [Mucilaginibacter sp. dw_454]
MKATLLLLITAFSLLTATRTFAQDTDDPATNYKAALGLVNDNKATDGIPYLENVVKTNSNYTNAAYSLLGSIYDKSNQPQKAIATYKAGLNTFPQDQNLNFNLGIAYFRDKQYAQAELAAIESIKIDPKHANSQRLYGLVTFHQNKRANALLAFCNFLLIEPNGEKSDEALTNMQSILKGGVLKAEGPSIAENVKLNSIISASVASGQAKKLSGNALLEYQLKTIFTQVGQLSAQKPAKNFFDTFYADYFYKLTQSGNLPGFVKLLTTKTEDAGLSAWVSANAHMY